MINHDLCNVGQLSNMHKNGIYYNENADMDEWYNYMSAFSVKTALMEAKIMGTD